MHNQVVQNDDTFFVTKLKEKNMFSSVETI